MIIKDLSKEFYPVPKKKKEVKEKKKSKRRARN